MESAADLDESQTHHNSMPMSATIQDRIISAFAGSLMVSLIVTPFDVVKSQMQSQIGHAKTAVRKFPNFFCFDPLIIEDKNSKRFNGTLDGMIKVYRLEGYRGLWKGLTPTIIGHIPSSVIYYVGYDYLKEYLHDPLSSVNMEPYVPIVAGSFARRKSLKLKLLVIDRAIMSPLELLRTRIQASSNTSYQQVYHSIRNLVNENGFQSLWRGVSSTLWRDVPFSAIYWFSYEKSFSFVKANGLIKSDFANSFASGCVCGSLAAIITHPFDLVKTIQQISIHSDNSHNVSISIPRVVKQVFQDEGYIGLYRGLAPRLLKVAPACGIMITTYEVGKKHFQSYTN